MEVGKIGVFISYSRTDLQSAQKLEQIFQAEGIRVWRDRVREKGDIQENKKNSIFQVYLKIWLLFTKVPGIL